MDNCMLRVRVSDGNNLELVYKRALLNDYSGNLCIIFKYQTRFFEITNRHSINELDLDKC